MHNALSPTPRGSLRAARLAAFALLLVAFALPACDAAPGPADDEAIGVTESEVQALGPPGHWQSIRIGRHSSWQVDATGVDRGTSWRTVHPGEWPELPGPLGYGEGYLASTLDYGPDPAHKPITTYFRREFTTFSRPTKMYLRVMYDDGFVFYLNGKEGGRAAMPAGPIHHDTLALGHEAENHYVTFDVSAQIPNLVGGTLYNSLAFEVHQASPSSSDLVFDAEVLFWAPGSYLVPWSMSIPTGSQWRTWASPGAPPPGWRDADTDEDEWCISSGPFGFGEEYILTDVAQGPITSYFRTQFEYHGAVDRAVIDAMYDDGLVVFLNGHEIARPSMPAGPIGPSTLAFGHEANDRYETIEVTEALRQYLVQGFNTVAVEVHQGGTQSSDLVFDLGLRIEAAWHAQDDPAPAHVPLRGVDMIDADHGFAVGDTGLVLETQDGGAHWTWRMDVTGASLQAIQFVDAGHGWIVGDAGTILATVDGGATWQAQASGVDQALVGISMQSATDGWVIGGGFATAAQTLLHTVDGGATWTPVSAPSGFFTDVDFADAQHGWLVGLGQFAPPDVDIADERGVIYATTDGGATWARQWLAPHHHHVINDVEVIDASTVWAVGQMSSSGDGAILLVTHDGGATWEERDPGVGITYGLAAIDFAGPNFGWAVGGAGEIIHTQEGGNLWTVQQGPAEGRPWLVDVSFVDLVHGWTVGNVDSHDSRILYTETAGEWSVP